MNARPITAVTVGRRSLLRGSLLGGGALAVAAVQAGCCTGSPSTSVGPSQSTTGRRRASILLAYFSRAGENYFYGDRIDLEVGNTEVLAGIVSRRLRDLGVACDVHRIDATDPYPEDYDETVARNVREQDTDARPELADPWPRSTTTTWSCSAARSGTSVRR